MATIDDVLDSPRPSNVVAARAQWPVRDDYHPSPVDWRAEVLYFFLPDRFSDETPAARPLLDRTRLADARGGVPAWDDAAWHDYAYSGRTRFQGGTLRGAASRLGYLAGLGVTTLWVGPVWKQRRESFVNDVGEAADEYHGYAIQDFFDVDPRFGTRRDLVDLVRAAHDRGIRVIFDIVLNHTARNFLYRVDGTLRPVNDDPRYESGRIYDFGAWLDGDGQPIDAAAARGPDDAVWPSDLQDPDVYHRRGQIVRYDDRNPDGSLNMDPGAQLRVADMFNRDLDLTASGRALNESPIQTMIACWTYWIALTDCDGFRIDTLKHLGVEDARVICNALREYAETLGKYRFLLAGEVAGGEDLERAWLQVLDLNLSATLDLGDARRLMRETALGNGDPDAFLGRYNPPNDPLPGSHRAAGSYFVTSIDDHDDTSLPRQRFPSLNELGGPDDAGDVASFFHPLQTVPGSALLLLTLGIPCLYYGAEQGLSAPARAPVTGLPFWNSDTSGGDRYLREAMFGPEHPRPLGVAGRPAAPGGVTQDLAVRGFGPFGTTGHHVFDPAGPQYRRIQALLAARAGQPPLQLGRQYARPVTVPGDDPQTGRPVPGIVAWSRILAGQEVVVVVNTTPPTGPPPGPTGTDVQVLVDADLNPAGSVFRVVASTAQCDGLAGQLDSGTALTVRKPGLRSGVTVPGLPGHEVVILARNALGP